MGKFVSKLASLAQFRDTKSNGDTSVSPGEEHDNGILVPGEVSFQIGEIAEDVKTGEIVDLKLNGPGNSPHMAIMGNVGTGKTRTAVYILTSLRRNNELPILAFDFKGDLAEKLAEPFDATVITPTDTPIPLNVLHIGNNSAQAINLSSASIRDSIASIKDRRPSGMQKVALFEAITNVLNEKEKSGSTVGLVDVANALETQYEEKGHNQDELTATLSELTKFNLFEATNDSPLEFFSKSWIINLPQNSSKETKRMVINLTLNTLDSWLNSLKDSPVDDQQFRSLRHLTFLDEAHVILSSKLPALNNLIRMSRSKGGVIMLASQSPDDFDKDRDEGLLDNMGLTMSFRSSAKPGATKRIFGKSFNIADLGLGHAYCRIQTETNTREILAWKAS